MSRAAPALPFEFGEPSLYHDPRRHGFFAVLQKHRGRVWQESYRLAHMPEALRLLPRDRDSWLSQAEFIRPNRRLVNLARIGLQFSDLDTYCSAYADHTPHQQLGALLDHLGDANKPLPSIVLFTGRGMAAKWVLDGTVPRAALPRWNAVQRHIGAALAPFGADAKARDASRVLRLERSVNTKSGEVVRVLWPNTRDGEVVRYGFDDIANEFLPLTREELAELRRERQAEAEARERRSALRVIQGGRHGLRRLSVQQLWWDRTEDLRRLAALRGWHHGNPAGLRNDFLFVAVCGLCWSVEPPQLHHETAALAREFCPTWTPTEVWSNTGAAIRRAMAHASGRTVPFAGRELDPRYRFTNARLIEWLSITPDEERQLQTIISEGEAARRHREREERRRRAAGAVTRAEYEGRARDRHHQAHLLRSLGHSNAEIAAALGTTVRHVRRLLATQPEGGQVRAYV